MDIYMLSKNSQQTTSKYDNRVSDTEATSASQARQMPAPSDIEPISGDENLEDTKPTLAREKSEKITSGKVKRFDAAYSIVSRLAAFSIASLATWMCATGNPSNATYLVGIADIFLKASQTQTVVPDHRKDGSSKPEDEQ
jgi:hypothetical protein